MADLALAFNDSETAASTLLAAARPGCSSSRRRAAALALSTSSSTLRADDRIPGEESSIDRCSIALISSGQRRLDAKAAVWCLATLARRVRPSYLICWAAPGADTARTTASRTFSPSITVSPAAPSDTPTGGDRSTRLTSDGPALAATKHAMHCNAVTLTIYESLPKCLSTQGAMLRRRSPPSSRRSYGVAESKALADLRISCTSVGDCSAPVGMPTPAAVLPLVLGLWKAPS